MIVWRADKLPSQGLSAPWTPSVDNHYVVHYNHFIDPNKGSPTLYILDRKTGNLLASISSHFINTGTYVGSPVLDNEDGLAITADYPAVAVYDLKQRKIISHINMNTFSGQLALAPALNGSDKTIYAATYQDYSLWAVLYKKGEKHVSIKWAWNSNAYITSSPVVTKNYIFISSQAGELTWAIDRKTGHTVWTYPAGGELSLSNDTLYIADQGTYGAPRDTLYAISIK